MPRVKIDYVVSFSSESLEAPASSLLANEAGRGRWLCSRGEPTCSVLLQLPRAVQISSITIGAHLAALVEVLVGRSETPNDPFQVLVASSVFLSPIDSRRATEGDSAADRVRSFNTDQLAADTRSKRWDRVRVVCSQPYNKHCKYGLSFIHFFSPEGDTTDKDKNTASEPALKDMTAVAKPILKLPLDISPQDSDDDELKPGALFAKHFAASQAEGSTSSTDAQIRKATSEAIKNVFSSSTKIVRTPISKPKGDATASNESRSDRTRESLMYEDEDAGPNDKIDRLVAAHKDQQAKHAEKANKDKEKQNKDKEKILKEKSVSDSLKQKRDRSGDGSTSNRTPREKHRDRNREDSHKDKTDNRHKTTQSSHKDRTKSRSKSPQSNKRDRSSSSKRDHKDDDKYSKQKNGSKEQHTGKTLYAEPVSDTPHELLRGVTFVMSGYENPRRAAVRDAALAMGAQFQRDWTTRSTHLICAFPNTPKLKTVRSSPDGDKAIIVTAEWIERQAARCRRLPWQWFATEPKFRVQRTRQASGEDPPGTSKHDSPQTRPDAADSDSDREPSDIVDVPDKYKDRQVKEGDKMSKNQDKTPDSELDTDDEIERVMRKKNSQKRDRTSNSDEETARKKIKPDKDLANSSQVSDVAFVPDERIKAEITLSDSDNDNVTVIEDVNEDAPDLSIVDELPSFFEGCTFAVHTANKPVLDEQLVRRYVTAYGGEIVEAHDDDKDIEVDYVLCLSNNTEGIRAKGRKVHGDWVWKCHERRRLCSPGAFTL